MFTETSIIELFTYLSTLTESFAKIYDAILNLSIPEPVIDGLTALGVSLTSLFFCMEMFSQMAQFRAERFEDAIRLSMKFVVAKVIIENTSGIAGGIKAIFMKASTTTFVDGMNTIQINLPAEVFKDFDKGFMSVNYMILYMFGSLYLVVFFVIFVSILISIVGIIFEITIHQAVAPVALSTLCNDTVRQTGITFIKSYAAVCLQLGVIGVIFSAFSVIMPKLTSFNIVAELATSSIIGILASSFMPLICLVVLSKAIKSSCEVTKRMLGV